MSQSFEVTGKIHSVGQTAEYGKNNFKKREFVLLVTGPDEKPEWPNHLQLELIKDKCESIDAFTMGQEIKVSFNLSGRLWDGGKGEKCFNSLQAWRIEATGSATPAPSTPAPVIPEFDPEQDSDLPF